MDVNSMSRAYLETMDAAKNLEQKIIGLQDTHRALSLTILGTLRDEIKSSSEMILKISEMPNISVDQKSDLTSSVKRIKFAVERVESCLI